MFLPGWTTRRSGDGSLAWQVLLIVPPVIMLSVVAIYSLRTDRETIERDARRNAAVLAPDLARRWGARVEADLSALVASACSAGGSDTEPAASNGGAQAPAPVCGLVINGQVRVPLDYPRLPSPPEWLRALAPADMKRWQAVASATAATDPIALERAAASLADATDPVRLNAEWSLIRTKVHLGAAVNPASQLLSLASRTEGIETESGAPMADLALLLAFGQLPPGGLSDVLLQDLERHILEHPSFLTATLIEEAARLAPRSRVAARIAARWTANERALTLLSSLGPVDGARPSEVWLGAGADQWVAFVHPIATAGAGRRSVSQVALVPLARLERVFQAAPQRDDLPAYATAAASLGGRSFYAGRPPAPAVVPVELASGRGQFALPLAVPADTVATFAGLLARVAPDAMPVRQQAPGATIRLNGVPGAHAFALSVGLVDPGALYASYRLRLWMAVGLILTATLAALAGLASTWRAFERQRRLSEMKSNFVASVSHELRAPIGAMRLMTESLERGTVPDAGRQQEYFRLIGQECRRLSSLVENVLDFSRIDRGSREYLFEPADLGDLTARTLELMQPYAGERHVTLVLAPAPPSGRATVRRIDREALQQALMNLVDNAIKHSPPEAEVSVGLETDEGGARITVEDRGPGIPIEEQARIFEPFYRRGSELRRETRGIGIGLSIAKHIVEAHGGRIEVESSPGSGSRFTIVIPAGEDAP